MPLWMSNQLISNFPTDYIFKHGNSVVRVLAANEQIVQLQNKSGHTYTLSYIMARKELASLVPGNFNWKKRVMKKRLIASDTEAASLDARFDPNVPMWCAGFYGQTLKKVMRWEKAKDMYLRLLQDPTVIFVFHNASFDVAALRIRGVDIPVGRYIDTMVMSYIMTPDSSDKHSLENCAYMWLGEHKLPSPRFDEYTAEMAEYCGQDTKLAFKLANKMLSKLKEDKPLYEYFKNVEMPYVECIIEMQQQGIWLNRAKLQQLREEYVQHIKTFLDEIRTTVPPLPCAEDRKQIAEKDYADGNNAGTAIILRKECISTKPIRRYKTHYTFANANWHNAGKYDYVRHQYDTVNLIPGNPIPYPRTIYSHCELEGFNPNSTDHKVIALKLQGWEPEKFSPKTGKPVVDKIVLDSLDYPIARLCRQFSRYYVIVTRTVEPALELTIDEETDMEKPLRCNMNQCMTTTTRLSASNPNLQTIPARDKEFAANIRSGFIARPGHKLVVGDLDRIEIVVLAHYLSNYLDHHTLTNRLLSGEDVHQSNSDLWGLTKMFGESGRSKAKNGIFTLIYGGGVNKFADTISVDRKTAQEIWDNIHTMSPEVFELRDLFIDEAKNNRGYIHTTLGNRLFIPHVLSKYDDVYAEGERLCGNYPIQGTASAVFKFLQVRAQPVVIGNNARLCLVVHDEAIYECPDDNAEKFAQEMTGMFTDNKILAPAPVSATFHAADDWYTAKMMGG